MGCRGGCGFPPCSSIVTSGAFHPLFSSLPFLIKRFVDSKMSANTRTASHQDKGAKSKKASGPAQGETTLVLPKEVMLRCVGVPVLVSLKGGSTSAGGDSFTVHELSGILSQYDEDCNLLLTDVVHYELTIRSSSSSLAEDVVGEKRPRDGEGSAPKWRVVRQSRKAMVGGDRVAQIVPNPMMDSLLRLESSQVEATTN